MRFDCSTFWNFVKNMPLTVGFECFFRRQSINRSTDGRVRSSKLIKDDFSLFPSIVPARRRFYNEAPFFSTGCLLINFCCFDFQTIRNCPSLDVIAALYEAEKDPRQTNSSLIVCLKSGYIFNHVHFVNASSTLGLK